MSKTKENKIPTKFNLYLVWLSKNKVDNYYRQDVYTVPIVGHVSTRVQCIRKSVPG